MRVARRVTLSLLALSLLAGFAGAFAWLATASLANATAPPETTDTSTTIAGDATVPVAPPVALGPLIQSPPGCIVPAPALAVFRGRVINIDDPPTTAQFRVLSILAGTLQGHAPADRVLVVYGKEASFLEIGVEYIVGVRLDLDTDRLISRILRPAPLFGGDAVIGVEDSNLECPRIEDPVSTFLGDGSSVDSGVLTPLKDSRSSIAMAVVQPLAIALAILIGLVFLKAFIVSIGRSLRESTGSKVPLGRVRHHVRVATPRPLSDAGD